MTCQEKERNEQLRVELCQSKLRQEQANRELTDANGKLVEMECAKRPSSTPAVSLQHSLKSSATIRCYETKIKGLESDVEEKVGMFTGFCYYVFRLIIIIHIVCIVVSEHFLQ